MFNTCFDDYSAKHDFDLISSLDYVVVSISYQKLLRCGSGDMGCNVWVLGSVKLDTARLSYLRLFPDKTYTLKLFDTIRCQI